MDDLVRTFKWRTRGEPKEIGRPSQSADRIQRIKEDQPEALRLNKKAMTLAKEGRIKEALTTWQKVLRYSILAEMRGMVLFNMARTYEKMDDEEQAIKLYEESVATNPEQFNAITNLGAIYLRQDRSHEALPHLLKAANLDPEERIAVNNLIICYETIGDSTQADYWRTKLRSMNQR